MPIPEEMHERITSSKIADLPSTTGSAGAAACSPAAFLREFTGGLPWAHLDIAGPAFNSGGAVRHVTAGRHRLRGRDPGRLRAVARR